MYSKKINELATNLNPQETDLIPIGDANTGQLKTTTYNAISGISGDGVISGGIVTWTGTGLNFNISACTYILNGIRYTSPASTKTLAAADPTNDRIDVFAVDVNSQVVVIQGTPATNPIEPEGDTATTLGLTNVTIAAGATTPTNVSRDLIYDENVESWTKSVSVGAGTTYNLADTAFAYTGTKSILATMAPGFINFSFSKAVAMDISNYKSLSFAIRLNAAWTSNQILSVRFFNGSSFVTNNFQIGNNNNVGFNRNLAGQWQLITIPLNNTNLKFTNNAFTLIRIGTQNAACTYRLDTIQLNGGINNPIGGGTTPSNSFGFVNGSTGTASSTTATDTLNVVGTGLATTSASGKTLTIAVPTPIPSQTGNNGKFLTTNGSVVSWGTPTDTGITSLNSQTGTTQTFATGTSGTDFGISSAANTHTFNLPTASATNRGLLSSADWSTFNSKQNALNGTGFVKISGTTISYDNSTYITGNQTITLSGDISGSGTTTITTTIGANKVTNAMLAQIATASFLGRVSASTGNVETLTGTQATTLLDTFTSTLKGLVPASGGGTTNFLRADGTWAAAGGGNTIYTGDGTLTGNRTITMSTFELSFVSGANTNKFDNQGSLLMGIASNAGHRLDVSGTARVSGRMLINGISIASPATSTIKIGGSATTTGTNVTAVGYLSIQSNNYSNSTAIGEECLGLPAGNGNRVVGVGYLAGYYNTGSFNTYIGSFGGWYQTTGQNNVFLGDKAGELIASAAALTIANNSIFIGQGTRAAADNQTNQIVIGYAETGLGSNTTIIGNSSTVTTAIRGRLLLGTTTDSGLYQVDVNGTTRLNGRTTITGSSTSNGTVGQGLIVNPTLVAAANGDTLIANDLSATFTNGAFTGVRNILLRVNGTSGVYFFQNGNVNIGNITDTGFKLDVTGTLNVTGATTLSTTTISTALNMNASISFGAGGATRNIFFYNPASAAQRTGIGYFGSGANNGGLLLHCYGSLTGADILFGFGVDTSTATVTNTKMALFNSTGNLSIGGVADISHAILQLSSTTKGFLPPRMTTTQKNAITTPTAGLVVYDTTTNKLCCYDGTTWNDLF